jgi:hypothetical protein
MAGGLSTNTLVKVLDSISKILGRTNFFPTRLRKKIGEREWAELLGVKSEYIVAGSTGR